MTANVNTYSPRDGDVRWRIPQWPGIMATLAAERGANLLLVGEGGRVVFDGAAADVLQYLAAANHNGLIRMFEEQRAIWLSPNLDYARLGRRQFRINYPHIRIPRVADAAPPDGFPFETRLNELRASNPTVPASVASASVTWDWVRLP